MEQYIKMSLANEIYVAKKAVGYRRRIFDAATIMEKLGKWFDLQLYDGMERKWKKVFSSR